MRSTLRQPTYVRIPVILPSLAARRSANEEFLVVRRSALSARDGAGAAGCAAGAVAFLLVGGAWRAMRSRERAHQPLRQRGPSGPNLRSGASLMEVLVVIALIGLLLSLLGPAVQAARESARRASCQSRLRQVGLAYDAHHAAHGRYPGLARWQTDPASGYLMRRDWSVFVMLLPFLDQQPAYNKFNFEETGEGVRNDPATSQQNAELLQLRIPVVQCPSDLDAGGWCNYRVCMGTGPAWHETVPMDRKSARRGICYNAAGNRAADVRDGLSNTIFFSERVTGDRNPERYTPFTDIHFRTPTRNIWTYPDEAADDCRFATGTLPRHVSFAGSTWMLSGFNATWYNHALPPNARIPDCSSNDTGVWVTTGAISARSWHTGGVHAALGDGSVKFYSQEIDIDLWRALSSIAGNDLVEAP